MGFPHCFCTDHFRDRKNIGELLFTRSRLHCGDKSFRPFWNNQFSETLPCFTAANNPFFLKISKFRLRVEATLPTLATDHPHTIWTD